MLLCACQAVNESGGGAEPGRVLLRDEFKDNGSNWLTGAEPGAYAFQVTDGEYFLRSLNEQGVVTWKSIPLPAEGDFEIKAALRSYRTESDLGYGLCWGGDGGDSRFCLFLSRDRHFTVFRRDGSGIREYVPWTPSSGIDSMRNEVSIRRDGDVLRYAVNGKVWGGVPWEPFFGDRLGFAGDGVQDFAVEELTVLVP
jgi:hypothetical protein